MAHKLLVYRAQVLFPASSIIRSREDDALFWLPSTPTMHVEDKHKWRQNTQTHGIIHFYKIL